jgi:RNA polymerase sigma factor (sigma-70 family)
MRADAGLGMTVDALRLAYTNHHLALVRLATLLTRGENVAEDLVHDVFIRSADRLETLEDSEVYPYLRRSVVNAWRNHRRHLRVEERALPGLRNDPPRDAVDAVDDRQVVWRAIERLPGRQRAVVVLRYYEDLPDTEIARLLACSRITVRTQAKRALAKLRGVMEA